MGVSPDSICLHNSSTSFWELVQKLLPYGRGKIAACIEMNPAVESKYFNILSRIRTQSSLPFSIFLSGLVRQRSFRGTLNVETQTPPQVLQQLLRRDRWTLKFRSRLIGVLSTLIHTIRWAPKLSVVATKLLWGQSIKLGQQEYLSEYYRQGSTTPLSGQLTVNDLGPHNSLGFYDLESNEKFSFRWTCGLGVVLLPIDSGEYTVELNLAPVREFKKNEKIRIEYLNTKVLLDLKPGQFKYSFLIHFDNDERKPKPVPVFLISTTYRPLDDGLNDDRVLGIGFNSLSWQAEV
jgi:hypothetical protein